MVVELRLRIILQRPPAGVDFGLQHGKGPGYRTIQTQRSTGDADLTFEATITAKDDRPDGQPNFLGPLTQGPPTGRFLYIDVGQAAGQADSPWLRRIKIPLAAISWPLIEQATADAAFLLEASFPGTARDGGPSCATLKPISGWVLKR